MNDTVRAYLAAGFTTSKQMLEHARLRGNASYVYVLNALSEDVKQNSTAMVVVTATPPGKNICAMIRRLVAERTKLIVAAQPGPLAPGNFERLIRASMPDVEKKLRVMDVGKSVADAVSSAERNRHYSPSQALEVFCDQQLARNFSQEVADGSLKFDPTVIMARPTEIPTDDMEAILKAVQGEDLAAMHRVLDPHLFSDQDALRNYKDALFGQGKDLFTVGGESEAPPKKESVLRLFESAQCIQRESGDIAGAKKKQAMQGLVARLQKIVAHELSEIEQELEIQDPATRARFIKSRVRNVILALDSEKLAIDSIVVERIVNEFLTDIASSRELGMAKLDAILKAELGDHFDELEYLGTGRNGSAYMTPDGLIIKITTDPKEAESAERLQGERCEYIHHIHEVSQVDEQVWVILQEGGLEKLPQEYVEEFDIAMEIIETIGAGHAMRMGDAEEVKEIMVRSGHTDLCMLVAEIMKKFDLGGMLREVKQLGLSADFHSGNIRMRGGRPVLTDLGTHGDGQKGPQGDGGQVSEIASSPSTTPGPLMMRGSNSSAWAGGRMVLSKPEQHVPEDENDKEDIVGGGLDWGRTPRLNH